nr:hypothetical protein [Tanacetum cinerariifolium]
MALFEIDGNKAPGPDGYSAQFFKDAWNVVGSEIATPSKVSDFCPIACYNVIYKVISKIISNRLKGVLGSLVVENQCAFIPSRQISDNILISQELMRGYHINRGFAKCAFKVDIQKAYDSVEWEFLACCLKAFGFHDTRISKSASVLKKALDEFGVLGLLPCSIVDLGLDFLSVRISGFIFIESKDLAVVMKFHCLKKK